MKALLTIPLCLFLLLNVYSQDFQVFISGGTNYYALVGNGIQSGNDTSFQLNDGGYGFNIGYGVLKMFRNFEVSAAIEFSQRQTARFQTFLERDEVYNYISLPVQLKYEFLKNSKFIFQNRLDYLIHNQKISLINIDTGESYLSKFDIGIGGGISYILSNFELQIIGDIGLVCVENKPTNGTTANDSIQTRSRLIKLNLLYLF